ncbi:GNAT family N-acetyltransferase [Actinoplanes sp. NPDC049681]|uniref:GNAT family N-acetyltransferase n=1 Tax=Actinoplanes sp. NPDC049681 TaxID=3363905 RepID=UPI0037A5EFA3
MDACVTALRHTYEADSYPLNWPHDPRRWLTPPGLLHAWVAEHPSGVVAGHVVLQRVASAHDGDQPVAELSRLYVIPAARRRSIASALVTHAREWASERNLGLTLTVTDQRRSGAVAFYGASGWQYTHSTRAGWLAPDGSDVTLRHYVWAAAGSE